MTWKVSSWLMGTQLTHKRLSFKNIYRWANSYTDGVCYSVKECQWWKGLGVCPLFYRWGGWGQKGRQHRKCTTRASLFPLLMLSSLQYYYALNPPICRCVCVCVYVNEHILYLTVYLPCPPRGQQFLFLSHVALTSFVIGIFCHIRNTIWKYWTQFVVGV